MNSSNSGGGHYQVPGGFENPGGAQRLPIGDVEFASRRAAAEQTSHDHTVTHESIIAPQSRLI